MTLLSDFLLRVEPDDVRNVIGAPTIKDGEIFFQVDVGRKSVAERVRRAYLAKASQLLTEFAASAEALNSADSELVTESIQQLFDWLQCEREKAAPRSESNISPQLGINK